MHLLKWSAAVTLGAGGSEQETAQGRRDLNLHFISGRPPKQCNLPSAWREREEPDEDGIVTGLRHRENNSFILVFSPLNLGEPLPVKWSIFQSHVNHLDDFKCSFGLLFWTIYSHPEENAQKFLFHCLYCFQ